MLLQPLAAPAHAANPVLDFFSALKDGQSAGRVQAAQYGLRLSLQQRQITQQYFNAAEQVSQRLINELAAKHPDSSVFAWMESHTRDSILSDPPNHASDLQAAAALIYQEAATETTKSADAAAKATPATRATETQRQEAPRQATQRAVATPQTETPAAEQKRKLPPGQAIPIVVVLVGGIAGLVWLMRRRRKPVSVSYVQVKSVPAADAPRSDQLPTTDRGTDGR